MAKKKSQKQLSKERADFLQAREDLLKKKVNKLEVKLFDKVFEHYLKSLKTDQGKIVDDVSNRQMVNGLNKIYALFQKIDNAPIIGEWLKDMNSIKDLNVRYFENISKEGVKASKNVVDEAINKRLGLTDEGKIVKDGFADKFARDDKMLRTLKKVSNKAIVKKLSLEDFRDSLKVAISGNSKVVNSGGLQKYYRNFAYDTYQQIDRLAGQKFADAFGLSKFIYQGGLIATSRPFCEHYNGKVVDAQRFSKLKVEDLPVDQRSGIPEKDWVPLIELGGYGCRHSKDWIQDDVAEFLESKAAKNTT